MFVFGRIGRVGVRILQRESSTEFIRGNTLFTVVILLGPVRCTGCRYLPSQQRQPVVTRPLPHTARYRTVPSLDTDR